MVTDRKEYNILVIEDNPGDFALVEDFLFEKIEAPQISQIETFKEAKAALSDTTHQYNVILLDLSLPDKTGEMLIKDIIELAHNTPVIVLTGYTDFDFGIRSLSLGVSDYILKDELTALSLYKSIMYSSERKRALTALEESEKRYSELFDASPSPIWVFDQQTLEIMDVNQAAIEHYGYTRNEFLSMTIKDIRPAEDIELLETTHAKHKNDKHAVIEDTIRHKKKNGEIIQVDIQSNLIEYKGRAAKVVVINDVTERLAHIKAIEEQNKKIRDMSWMQSHVIRAPLARMMGLMDLFMLDINDKEQIVEYLQISAQELDAVIKNITEISKTKTDS
jgi:PAS domain S-box-containing protein